MLALTLTALGMVGRINAVGPVCLVRADSEAIIRSKVVDYKTLSLGEADDVLIPKESSRSKGYVQNLEGVYGWHQTWKDERKVTAFKSAGLAAKTPRGFSYTQEVISFEIRNIPIRTAIAPTTKTGCGTSKNSKAAREEATMGSSRAVAAA